MNNETIQNIRYWLMVTGIVLAVALLAGVVVEIIHLTDFPVAFWVTVVTGAAVGWFVKHIDEL